MQTCKKTPFVMVFPSNSWIIKEKKQAPALRYSGTMRGLMQTLKEYIKKHMQSKGLNTDQCDIETEAIIIQCDISMN